MVKPSIVILVQFYKSETSNKWIDV